MSIELRPPEKWAHLQYHWIRDPRGRSIIYEWAADAKSWTRTGDEQDYGPDSFVDGWTYWKPCDPGAVMLDLTDEGLSDTVASAIGATQLLVSGTLLDLLCVSNYANDHSIHRLLKDAAKMAITAINKERGT